VNKVVLAFVSAFVGVLGKIVTSVHGYEREKQHIFYSVTFFFRKSWHL